MQKYRCASLTFERLVRGNAHVVARGRKKWVKKCWDQHLHTLHLAHRPNGKRYCLGRVFSGFVSTMKPAEPFVFVIRYCLKAHVQIDRPNKIRSLLYI